ncbi:hypothetical protein SGRA_0437 [Saprospira grandis str. Lewin]|uniref:Uncharacterized protein n=1 Tax=Saprospira grandis (strain Lewin) TaxID=984262 RepID=H6L940_SAPGL|nr:hypothetical protein SGRA_0437 [Saprospira grandis str. Lewin]
MVLPLAHFISLGLSLKVDISILANCLPFKVEKTTPLNLNSCLVYGKNAVRLKFFKKT